MANMEDATPLLTGGNEERWKRSRSWKGDLQQNDWSKQRGLIFFCRGASSVDWRKARGSRAPAKKESVSGPTGRETSHTRECREPGAYAGSHYIKEDTQKFEEAERETHEKLQMPFLDGKEVEQLTEDREIIGESLVFLRQY